MKEKIYYHVVTEKPMYLGEKIKFDALNQSGVYKRVMDKSKLIENIYLDSKNYDISELDHHTKVAIRELALEKIRKKYFPNYPSRLKSLYVSKDLETAKMWADIFIKKGRKVFQIVKVKHQGNEFTGNAYNCFDGTLDESVNLKLATAYWNNVKNKSILLETIIDGNIEVIEIVKEYN